MKTQFLLPNRFKKIGLVLLFIVGLLLILFEIFADLNFLTNVPIIAIYDSGYPMQTSKIDSHFFNVIHDDIQFELISILAIIGGLFVAFSRQKNEDEFISKIRMDSLVWATYAHFAVLIIMIFSIFGLDFLNVLFANMFTILILFILRFHYKVYKLGKSLRDEE